MTIVVPEFYMDSSGKKRAITLDANSIPRDQWGRPVIRKADGTWAGFTRISSIAKELDRGEGLSFWKSCMTAIGVAIDPDIRRRIEEMVAFSDNPYEDHKTELGNLSGQAQEVAGSTIKRELGTTLHEWCQILDRTGDLGLIPAEHLADVTAYRDRMVKVDVLESETFVVVDEIEVAGSLDKLLAIPGLPSMGVLTGDIKTGQREPKYPMNAELQVSGYSRGSRYNLRTGERTPLHPDINIDDGVLIHLPAGTGTCELYPLNLRRGWQNLMLAKDLKKARRDSSRNLKPLEGAA